MLERVQLKGDVKGAVKGDKSAAKGTKGASNGDKHAVKGAKGETKRDKGAGKGIPTKAFQGKQNLYNYSEKIN